jgi:hypothetical protein
VYHVACRRSVTAPWPDAATLLPVARLAAAEASGHLGAWTPRRET